MEIPVYVFTGFLEAGKTRFIQETLEDKRFIKGERTLLLLCEGGEEEYEPDRFSGENVFLHTVDDAAWFTPDRLSALVKRTKAERVVVEYNGMWQLSAFYDALPDNWMVYQEMMFAEAATFASYNANMRSLVVDKLQGCELVIFNRCPADVDKMALHRIVRSVTRRADIAYDFADGRVEYDDIEDPLPFDIDAPVVEIADSDYALWYRDMTEDAKKYIGKTLRFKGLVATDGKMPKGSFVIGRHIMTCCADDIQYGGVVAAWPQADTLRTRDWVTVTATFAMERHAAYRGKGPVLHVTALEPAAEPEQPVATFY